MNDHEAIDAITETLDAMYRDGNPYEALNRISQIIGENKISHNEAKEQK